MPVIIPDEHGAAEVFQPHSEMPWIPRCKGLAILPSLERDAADSGDRSHVTQRGDYAHQRRLAGAMRAEQALHSGRNGADDIVQRLHAVGIGL